MIGGVTNEEDRFDLVADPAGDHPFLWIRVRLYPERENGSCRHLEIQGHPREWVGKTVQVSGEVKEAFSLVLYKYFVVKDKTGEIQW